MISSVVWRTVTYHFSNLRAKCMRFVCTLVKNELADGIHGLKNTVCKTRNTKKFKLTLIEIDSLDIWWTSTNHEGEERLKAIKKRLSLTVHFKHVCVCVCVSMFVCYLGNGSRAASPSVQHHGVLMSFLQHLILHKAKQRHHSVFITS